MNKIYIFFGLVLLVSCGPSDIPSNGLEERLGVYYEVNSQIPYSGPIERYHVNGQLRFKANYKDGKKEDGLWEFYHDNGKLKDSGNYKDGKKEGFWEEYYQNGQLNQKGNYKDGKKEGFWEFYQDNGVLDRKVYYKDEKNVWVSNPQSPEDVVERNGITYQINQSNPFYGTVKFYHTGFYGDKLSLYVVVTYIDGKKNGSVESYHENGQVWDKGNYKDGKLDGPFEKYYQNGQLEYKKTYKDGKQHGLVESYDENGLCSTTRSKGSYYVEEVCSSN